MDKGPEILEKFEEILRNEDSNAYLNLYGSVGNAQLRRNRLNHSISAKDILSNVEKQIKSFQAADSVKTVRSVPKTINMSKKSSFLPINMLPQYEPPPPPQTSSKNKFETQCVSDTQLVNLIDDAEAIDAHQGITQEFLASFCDNSNDHDYGTIKNPDNTIPVNPHDIIKETNNVCSENPNDTDQRNDYNVCSENPNDTDQGNDYNVNVGNNKIISVKCEERSFKLGPDIIDNRNDCNPDNSSKDDDSQESQMIINDEDHFSNRPEDNGGNLDSESVIITNEPLDLENIPDEYEVFSIPVTIEAAESLSDDFESENLKNNEEERENLSENSDEEQVLDEDQLIEQSIRNREESIPIIDISLKEPDPNKLIVNVDIPETEFIENDNIFSVKTQNIPKNPVLDQDMCSKDTLQDLEMPSSPVFDIRAGLKNVDLPKSPQHLVVDLAMFEEFEKKALKAVDKSLDKETAKSLIDSQIIGKELFIQTDFGPALIGPEFHSADLNIVNAINEFKDEKLFTSGNKTTRTNEEVVRDEILFSSDEEEELLLNKVKIPTQSQDLPLTCALETSFYDQPDVLDQTMYVGFQTASNKSIQICTDSFYKAQSVFDNIEKQISGKEPSLIEMVKSCDVAMNICNEQPTDKRSIEEMNENDIVDYKNENGTVISENHEQNELNQDPLPQSQILPTKSINKSQTIGFKTASNKNIKLSNNALEKAKKVFDGIAVFENDHKIKEKLEDIRNKITNTIANEFDENSQDYSGNELVNAENGIKDKPEELGDVDSIEQTNSGKESEEIPFTDFNIDDISLLKEDLFDDCDFNEKMEIDDDTELSRHKCISACVNNVDLAIGFRTASNKCIKISEQALAKTKDIFSGIESMSLPNKKSSKKDPDNFNTGIKEDMYENSHGKQTLIGFDTESHKSINVTEEALLPYMRSSNQTESIDEDIIKHNSFNSKMFAGFQTASNKQIEISEKALAKTTTIFNDFDLSTFTKRSSAATGIKNQHDQFENFCNNDNKAMLGFKTASEKDISVSNEALSKTKNLFQDIYEETEMERCKNPTFEVKMAVTVQNEKDTDVSDNNHKIEDGDPTFSGFKTASNRKIQISADALSRTNKIFNDLIFGEDFDPNNGEEKSGELIVGFQTASSKPVKISEAALAKSRNIFKEIENSATDTDLNEKRFHGFHTANKKEVKISEKALEIGRKLFQDIDNDTGVPKIHNINPKLEGFKTASSKDVKISEKALARSRKLFKDLDDQTCPLDPSDIINPKFGGFKTAGNKEVNISEEALAKSRKLFQDLDNKTNNPDASDVNLFQGFKTASNKGVTISEKALMKSKKLFEDLDNITTPLKINKSDLKFQGFQTAANKKVTISPRALSRSRKILAELELKENKKETSKTTFGFQTANHKEVKVSDAALCKSRKLFADIDNEIEEKISLNMPDEAKIGSHSRNLQKVLSNSSPFKTIRNYDNNSNETNNFGFKTANNKQIKVSEESLAKSRNLFKEIEEVKDILKEKETEISDTKDINLDNIINTQVLNNFEESMHTEDFKEMTPVKSKRSGSPILSCPRPKRRKFEIPYSQKIKVQKGNTQADSIVEKDSNKIDAMPKHPEPNTIINFNSNYKKAKIMTLKQLDKLEKASTNEPEIDPNITELKFDNLLKFEFNNARNDISEKKITTQDIKKLFIESVNRKFVPDGWVENHLKLIIWKLLSYEIRFPKTMNGVCTVKNVIDQLKYRYDKELYNAERPALRKIMEKDDVASKTLVLCVADIIEPSVDSGTKPPTTDLLLTDGWYTIRASTDRMLTRLVSGGKIAIGTKIVTSGAEVLGCEQGVAPWEDTSAIRLKISGNSTRRARWFARLGYYGTRTGSFGDDIVDSALSSVTADGGKVAKVRVFVTRVYPALYVEKFEDGSTVTRSERLEIQHQMKHEAERQSLLEKLYEEVEKELSDQDSQDSDGADSSAKRRCLDTGSQIAKLMKKNKDPNEFRANLTDSQKNLLQAHTMNQREKLLQAIQNRVQDKIAKSGLSVSRNVVTLLKVRVVGIEEKKDVVVTRGMLSVWKPNDELMEIIKEGTWIDVMNVLPTAIRNSEIQLSAGRQSVFVKPKFKESEIIKPYTKSLKRTCYPLRDLAKNPGMTTDYSEIDTIGIIFLIDPPIKEFDSKKFQFQNAYLADADKNMISINFWGGLKKYGVENILETSQIVSCTNLQKRAGNTRKNIPQYRATEYSYFTKTSKYEDARKLMEELRNKMSNIDKEKFCEDCVNLKNNFAVFKSYGNADISPYRFQDVNMSRNKMFIDSPFIARKTTEDNFNLSGLDFESTFKQADTQDMSPKLLLRKRQLNEKIAKLRMYGDPPPLSPIQIVNKSKKAGNAFKSPLAVKPSDTNVKDGVVSEKNSDATAEISVNKKLSENIAKNNNEPSNKDEEIQCSPVLNRTYVKKDINPVRLNFSKNVAIDENDISDVVDQFGEDFDGSPPLSLD